MRRGAPGASLSELGGRAALEGIRVLDLTQNLAGPFCGQILADLGADVIKVEPPGGDPARAWGPPFWEGESTLYLSANRGKRSIVLDLKDPSDVDTVHRLAARSDVVLQSSRLGVAERLGFDYEAIRALRPDVIHMSLTAYGTEGPLAASPGYDPLIQAFAGIMSVTGHPGGEPARVGGSVVDFGTGMWAALSVLAALRTRDRTGKGARLDTSLLGTALHWVSYHLLGTMATGEVPGPMGSGLASIAPYQSFATADGQVMIAAGNDGIFRRLCEALSLEGVADDPRFSTNSQRVAHRQEVVSLIAGPLASLDTDEVLDRMARASVPCSAIHDLGEVLENAQVAALGLLRDSPHARNPEYRDLDLPFGIDGDRPRAERPPPAADAHRDEILAELEGES